MIGRSSHIGNGLDFNGTDQYVHLPNYGGGNQISVEVLFEKNGSIGNFSTLFFIANQSTSNQEYFFLAINETTGRVILYVASDSGNVVIIEGPVISIDSLNSVVGLVDYSAQTMSLHVNNELIGSDTLGAGTYTMALTPPSIGRASYNVPQVPTHYLDGQVHRVSVYDRLLTSGEIDSLYRGIIPSPSYAFYDFNQTSGNTVWDTSGNNNHGTAFNSPEWVDENGNIAK